MKKLKSYLKDDNDFLGKINDINQKYQLSKNALLVTWDVKSLYTSIPWHKDGLEALKKTLQEENVDKSKATTMLDFSKLFLTSNYFKFLGSSYLQKSGTAMGTKMAPTYTNLLWDSLKRKC